jgi:hypothetical protein
VSNDFESVFASDFEGDFEGDFESDFQITFSLSAEKKLQTSLREIELRGLKGSVTDLPVDVSAGPSVGLSGRRFFSLGHRTFFLREIKFRKGLVDV